LGDDVLRGSGVQPPTYAREDCTQSLSGINGPKTKVRVVQDSPEV